jgi:hypothetical protein
VATYRARMKILVGRLRFAQMHTRLDIYGLINSKKAVKEIARQMRELIDEEKKKRKLLLK